MNKKLLLILCLFGLIPGTNTASAEDEHEADRAYFREMLPRVENAINSQDIDTLASMLDKDVVVIYQDAEVVRGIDELKAYYEKMLGKTGAILKSYSTKAKHAVPARFMGDVAVVDGSAEDRIVFINGSEILITTVWSVTLQKEANEWKVIQLHFSANLFDNPLLASAKNNLWIAAVGAGIAGLLLGAFFGGRRARRG